jgi:hypothetical protein
MSKTQLLELMKVKDHEAVEAVIYSGLLPEPQLNLWLDSLVKRAILRIQGKSGIPEWETWATDWLSGADRSVEKAASAAQAAREEAAREEAAREEAARSAARSAAWAAWTAADAAQAAWVAQAIDAARAKAAADAALAAREAAAWSARAADEEIEDQYLELLEIINAL